MGESCNCMEVIIIAYILLIINTIVHVHESNNTVHCGGRSNTSTPIAMLTATQAAIVVATIYYHYSVIVNYKSYCNGMRKAQALSF